MSISKPSSITSHPKGFRAILGKTLVVIACLLFAADGYAQLDIFLLLEKPGTSKRIRYYAGDEIIFKTYETEGFNHGVIEFFSDTSIFFNKDTEVKLREIEAVADRSKVEAVRSVSRGALLVIPGFFLFSIANNAFNTGRTPLVDPEVYYLAGGFAVLGGLGYLYKGKRYRLKGRWRLIVINH
jgi:hypothetical protein